MYSHQSLNEVHRLRRMRIKTNSLKKDIQHKFWVLLQFLLLLVKSLSDCFTVWGDLSANLILLP